MTSPVTSVMPGSCTSAPFLHAGDHVEARFRGLGTVAASFAKAPSLPARLARAVPVIGSGPIGTDLVIKVRRPDVS